MTQITQIVILQFKNKKKNLCHPRHLRLKNCHLPFANQPLCTAEPTIQYLLSFRLLYLFAEMLINETVYAYCSWYN